MNILETLMAFGKSSIVRVRLVQPLKIELTFVAKGAFIAPIVFSSMQLENRLLIFPAAGRLRSPTDVRAWQEENI